MNCSRREVPGLALGIIKKKGILSSYKKIVLGFIGEDEGLLVWKCQVCQSHITMLRPNWRSGLLGMIAIHNIVFLGVTPPQTFEELMGRTVLQRSLSNTMESFSHTRHAHPLPAHLGLAQPLQTELEEQRSCSLKL